MKTRIHDSIIALAILVGVQKLTAQVTFSGNWYYKSETGSTSCSAYNDLTDVIGSDPRPCSGPCPSSNFGQSGSLSISNGAVLTDGGGQIGAWQAIGCGNDTHYFVGSGSVLVDGVGSLWDNSVLVHHTNNYSGQNGLRIGGGWQGSSGYLTIQNGGVVHTYGFGTIGGVDSTPNNCCNGSYGSVIVNGYGSTWTISHRTDPGYAVVGLSIGAGIAEGAGGWGQLVITNGGTVLVGPPASDGGNNIYVRSSSLGISSVVVDGAGSSLLMTNGFLTLGAASTPACSMTIRNGGYVYDIGAQLSSGSTVLVDGPGSTWFNDQDVPSHGTLTFNSSVNSAPSVIIQNGGRIQNSNQTQLSDNSHLIVNGAGSVLTNYSLAVGGNSSVLVQNGGSIQCGGVLSDSGVGSFVVDGAGSSIVCGHTFSISSSLMLRNGGSLTVSDSYPISFGVLGGNGVANCNLSMGGKTLAPGDGTGGIGTLTINGSIYSGSPTIYDFAVGSNSDQIIVSSNLTLYGTLHISTFSGVTAGSYTLFTYGGTLTLGGLGVTGPAGFSYSINTSTPGRVNLILTSNPPRFAAASLDGSNLIFSGTSGFPLSNFYIVTSTNLTSPKTQWPIAATNQFDATGNFTFTNVVDPNAPQKFYSIRLP